MFLKVRPAAVRCAQALRKDRGGRLHFSARVARLALSTSTVARSRNGASIDFFVHAIGVISRTEIAVWDGLFAQRPLRLGFMSFV